MEKPFNPLDIINKYNYISSMWIYKLFIIYAFDLVYFFLTIILLILGNLSERKCLLYF
jgi:hypothetical protein